MMLSIIVFFLFNYCTFIYISKLIDTFNKSKPYYIGITILNVAIMLILYSMKAPYYISYFVALITLTLEFSNFNKKNIPKCFLYSGILVINASSIRIFLTTTCSYILNIKPYKLFLQPKIYFFSLFLLFLIMFVVFRICLKLVSIEDIKKISGSQKYCSILSSIILVIITSSVIDIKVLNSTDFNFELVPALMFTPIMTLVIFYVLAFYTVKSLKITDMKQKTSELERLRTMNLLNKKNMQNKIIKDDLTGCYNRKYIFSKIQSKFDNNIFNFGIFFIDINKLKFVNDTLGHDFGDEYILNVSKAIKQSIRQNDLVAKIGGDEFLILLSDIEEEHLEQTEKRIRENLEEIDKQTENYNVSASMGYVFVDERTIKLGMDEVIRIADEKMRYNKKCFKGENS